MLGDYYASDNFFFARTVVSHENCFVERKYFFLVLPFGTILSDTGPPPAAARQWESLKMKKR